MTAALSLAADFAKLKHYNKLNSLVPTGPFLSIVWTILKSCLILGWSKLLQNTVNSCCWIKLFPGQVLCAPSIQWDCSTRVLLLLLLCLLVLLVVSGSYFFPFFPLKLGGEELLYLDFPSSSACVQWMQQQIVVHSPTQSFPTFYGSLEYLRPISGIPSFPCLLTLALLTHTQLFPEVKQCIISGACGAHRKLQCTAFPHLQN